MSLIIDYIFYYLKLYRLLERNLLCAGIRLNIFFFHHKVHVFHEF